MSIYHLSEQLGSWFQNHFFLNYEFMRANATGVLPIGPLNIATNNLATIWVSKL